MADEDIFRHIRSGKIIRFLVDGCDTVNLCLSGVGNLDRVTIQQYFATIRLVDAVMILNQGRFSGSVFAKQGMDLSG